MAGYTRQSAAQIVSGEVISAAPLNAELNQVLAAFNETSGHSHDGTSAEGPPIDRIADADQNNKILIDTSNDHLEFYTEGKFFFCTTITHTRWCYCSYNN